MAKSRIFGAVLVLLGCITVLCAAADFIDQQQDAVDASAASFEIGGAVGQELAQTVTAGVTGRLVEVRLPVHCPAGILTLEVRGVTGGVLDRTILASHSFSTESPAADSRFQPIPLPAAPTFVADDRFALVLRATEECELLAGPLGSSYAGGDGFYRNSETDAWLPLGVRADLPFQTVIETGAQKVVVHFQSESHREDDEEKTGAFVRVNCFLRALAR